MVSNYRDNDGRKRGKGTGKEAAAEEEEIDDDDEEVYEDAPINQGLLSRKRKTIHDHYKHAKIIGDEEKREWMRPYCLGLGLFLILFAFWLLDSLKDPIFVSLVDGKISYHQPPAKMVSVGTTLVLVCLLEYYVTTLRQKQKEEQKNTDQQHDGNEKVTPSNEVLDPGGVWKRIQIKSSRKVSVANGDYDSEEHVMDDLVSVNIFYYIGIPYLIAFMIISYFVWRFEQQQQQQQQQQVMITTTITTASTTILASSGEEQEQQHQDRNDKENSLGWYVLGYVLYATVESFGSLAVAAFWSYTNSTLSLIDAEKYYGPVIATAQLGAIIGSTLVASGRWESSHLLVVVALSIILQLLLMRGYDRKFEPTSLLAVEQQQPYHQYQKQEGSSLVSMNALATPSSPSASTHRGHPFHGNNDINFDAQSVLTWQQDDDATITKPFWSGLYLIFRHSYVLMILGVSCLYEVSMTLLDYQMKLLGFAKFNNVGPETKTLSMSMATAATSTPSSLSFTKFMGHYGQVVNVTSLIFSAFLFPFLIRRLGLRKTLICFPTLLLIAAFLAYGAMPGNLTVLFVSLSLLKAMTYSVHDPSKELLYIPTSNAVKFRAKFWIDVVGERVSKAVGSAFNAFANNIEQSVKIGSVPSLLSALGLWLVCYYVGIRFDELLKTGKIVGLELSMDPSMYKRIPRGEESEGEDYNNEDYFNDNNDHYRNGDEPSEVEIGSGFEEDDNVSTLDLMAEKGERAQGKKPQQKKRR